MARRVKWLALAALLGVVLAPSAVRPSAADEAGVPVLLAAPALGIWAPVATFALNDDLTMPVPQEAGLVAWYQYSARAGVTGNAVLAGHRDWQGRRGVFYDLGRLAEADEVWLRDAAGAWHRYRVVWSASIEDAVAPLDDILGPTRDAVLTLITCSGTFDRTTGRYTERRVVRAAYELTVFPEGEG